MKLIPIKVLLQRMANNGTRTFTTTEMRKLSGLNDYQVRKQLKATHGVWFMPDGKFSHWIIDLESTAFIPTINHMAEERNDGGVTLFEAYSMQSMLRNCTRRTIRPNTVLNAHEQSDEQVYREQGLNITF